MPPTISQETIPGTMRTATPGRELEALLTSAAVAPLAATGWIKITGSDRVRWLNGMVTNSIQTLAPGEGCYNFLLSAQGRIQGDATVFAEPSHLLLETSAAQLPNIVSLLDRFIIMDDVELTDITSERAGLLLAGPQAPDLLGRLKLLTPAAPAPSLTHQARESEDLIVLNSYGPLIPRFELWASSTTIDSLSAELHDIIGATPAALDYLRILEGTPVFGVDIRDRDLPQETGVNRALHFSKGCYLGQEIVERIRSRGQVHRIFAAFTLTGDPATAGTPLTVEGKPAGELTSTATLQTPAGDLHLALGYIRREFLVGNKPIAYTGGVAQPSTLPFDISKIISKIL